MTDCRTTKQSSLLRTASLLLTVLLALAPACDRTAGPTSQTSPGAVRRKGASRHVALGMPSPALPSEASPNDYLLEKQEYVLSYNRDRGGPNWVSWHLSASDLGPAERTNEFHPEPDLPEHWRIRPGDYTGSGYDRGHLCPSADRTSSTRANEATFSMANMLPQAGNLNRVAWEQLESHCRDLVMAGDELHIVAGGYGRKATIARNRITVPERCWKIVVICPKGSDSSTLTADTPVIAVDMPNDSDIESDWRQYITTAQAIEQAAGLEFFTSLEPDVRIALLTRKGDGGPSRTSPSRPGAAEPSSEPGSGPVIGNKRSRTYHLPGCPDYDAVSQKNRVLFKSARDAERAGFRKAGNCP